MLEVVAGIPRSEGDMYQATFLESTYRRDPAKGSASHQGGMMDAAEAPPNRVPHRGALAG